MLNQYRALYNFCAHDAAVQIYSRLRDKEGLEIFYKNAIVSIKNLPSKGIISVNAAAKEIYVNKARTDATSAQITTWLIWAYMVIEAYNQESEASVYATADVKTIEILLNNGHSKKEVADVFLACFKEQASTIFNKSRWQYIQNHIAMVNKIHYPVLIDIPKKEAENKTNIPHPSPFEINFALTKALVKPGEPYIDKEIYAQVSNGFEKFWLRIEQYKADGEIIGSVCDELVFAEKYGFDKHSLISFYAHNVFNLDGDFEKPPAFVINNHTEIQLSLWERFLVLIGKPLALDISITVDKDVTSYKTTAKETVQHLFKRKPKAGHGYETIKPPLGLVLRKVAEEHISYNKAERIVQIQDAIKRYMDAGVAVPAEWDKELFDLKLPE